MRKKSFVMTGYVRRSTCNCGCVSNNAFWQDGGFGGSSNLSHLHRGVERFLDELSGADVGGHGRACDVKVTVTVEELGEHDHRIVNCNSFSGLGSEDNSELRDAVLAPSEPADATVLAGSEQLFTEAELCEAVAAERTVTVDYLRDVHDRILLARRTGDATKFDELMVSLQNLIG